MIMSPVLLQSKHITTLHCCNKCLSYQAFGDEDPGDGEQVGVGVDDEGEVGHSDRQVGVLSAMECFK